MGKSKDTNTVSPKGRQTILVLLILGLCAGAYLFFGTPKTTQNNNDDMTRNLPSIEDVNIEKEKANLDKATKEVDVLVDVVENVDDGKRVSLFVEEYGRPNPFLPPSESISDIARYGFDLMAPPETLSSEEVEAAKIMTTKVSGIMYNTKSSSAILNIEGSDYLVRSGDYINKYKVLAIAPDTVTVQLGNNVYKARVGEVITETLNHNTIDNLSNKFGGANK